MRAFAFSLIALASAHAAADEIADSNLETVTVAPGISMLSGEGGNIAVMTGPDAVFVIDDTFEQLSPKLIDALKAITPKPVDFLINTHWHWDHTGGNEALGLNGAVIYAHDNVRTRMSSEASVRRRVKTTPMPPKAALPVVTFGKDMTFHINGETIRAVHAPAAHTDGDAVLYFEKANVVHMGDIFFNGVYPFVDIFSGGTIEGMIAACDATLARVNDGTRIIPGHGKIGNKADLAAYRAMLVEMKARVDAAVKSGKSRAEILASKPTADLDLKWNWAMTGERVFAALFDAKTGVIKPVPLESGDHVH